MVRAITAKNTVVTGATERRDYYPASTLQRCGSGNRGTNNNGNLNFRTNGTTKLTVTTAGDLTFAQGANRILSVAANTTANGAGYNLTVSAGAANGSTTGSVGGILVLQGGNAAGTGNNNGGNVTIDGGTASGTGSKGSVVIQGNFTIDGSGNAVLGATNTIRLTGGTTAQRPGSPSEGTLYFDTDTKQLLTYANGKWQADRTNAVLVAATDSSDADKAAADYVADGTNDEVEINAALTAANPSSGTRKTGKVYLFAGTYTASATILIPNNTTLAGVGRGTLIKLSVGTGTDNLVENSDTITGTGVVIQDIRLDGSLGTGGTQHGIYLNAMGAGSSSSARQGAKLSNLWVNSFQNAGIYIDSSANNTISGNTFQGNNFVGIYLVGASYNTVTGNVAEGNGTGIYSWGASNNTISGNSSQGNIDGISLDGSSVNNIVTANSVQGNSQRGIGLLSSSNNNNLSGNKIHDNGGNTNNNGIYLDASDANTITGNDITDTSCTTTCYAINIFNSTSDNNYLSNNRFSTSSGTATINDAGTGTIYANQSRGANGAQLTTKLASGTDAFQIQNAAGNSLFTIDTANSEIELGKSGASGIDAKLVLYNAANSNTVTLSVGTTSTSYTLKLPTGAGNANECLVNSATPGTLTWTTCNTDPTITLQDAYDADTNGSDAIITLTSADGALKIRDASTPLGTDLFAVQSNNGSSTYLGVAAGGVTLGVNTTLSAGKNLVFTGSNSNTVTLQPGTPTSSYNLTLPTALGNKGDCLKDSTGAGVLGFASCSLSVARIEFTGHSQTYGYGTSELSQRWSTRLSTLLKAQEVNRGIPGANFMGGAVNNGGWVNVVQNVTRSRTAAPYLSPTNMAAIQLGQNDLTWTDGGNTNQVKHTLRTIISRYRAAAVFEAEAASGSGITYGGTWTNQGSSSTANSGSGYKQATANGATYTISVPSDFPGGTVTVGLIGVTGTAGATHTYTVDGNGSHASCTSFGCSFNTKAASTGIIAGSAGLTVRFTGLSAGAHTIVGTVGSITTSTGVDYWQIEAPQPPLVAVLNVARILNYSAYGATVNDTDVTDLNTAMQQVVSEFDSSVVYVDVDSAINKTPAYFYPDGGHFNDWGNAVIAATVYKAALNANVSLDQLAYTGGLTYTSDREVFRNYNNSTSAFSVQNAAGGNVLSVDTTLNNVNIGRLGVPQNTVGVASTTGGSLPAASYFYLVTARNATQESAPSASITVNTTGSTSSITLTWDPVPGATEYRVYFANTSGYFITTTNSFTHTSGAGTACTYNTLGCALNDTASGKLQVIGDAGQATQLFVGSVSNTEAQLSVGRTELGGSNNVAWKWYVPASSTDLRLANGASATDYFTVTATGQSLFKNSADSSTAFRIQSAGGSPVTLFTADTSNLKIKVGGGTPTLGASSSGGLYVTDTAEFAGRILIGTTTNGVDSTSGQLRYSGSYRNTKKIILTAEYAGASLDADGTNNIGTMTSGFDGANRVSYYKWTTTMVASQDYDIIVQIPVPSDFSAWASSTPFTIKTYSSNTGTATVTANLYDTNGTIETNWTAGTPCALTPAANTTWQTKTGCNVSGTYAADGIMTLRLHLTSPTNGDIRIGDIVLTYLSNF